MTCKITPSLTTWTPSSISTALWLDAADTNTITQSSGLVSQWNDKSGNGRNATATGTQRPTYTTSSFNSKPGISFNGTSNLLICDSLTSVLNGNDAPWSMVMAVNAPARGVLQHIFSAYLDDQPTAGAGSYTLRLTSSDFLEATRWSTGDANPVTLTGAASVAGASQIVVFTFYGTTALISLNGSAYVSGSFNSSAVTADFFTFGARRYGPTPTVDLYGQYVTPEIVFTTGALSTANRNLLEGYLAYKWGMTSNLPSDHPYKIVPPLP